MSELSTNNSQPLEIGAAYIRVSTDDQTELSPDAQLRMILDAAKADGFVIPKEYISRRKGHFRPQGRQPPGVSAYDRHSKIPEAGPI